jgi:hypothetical protein
VLQGRLRNFSVPKRRDLASILARRALKCPLMPDHLQHFSGPRAFSERLIGVGQLIDGGRIGEARIVLDESQSEPAELVELMRLKLSVAAREIDPSTALARVIVLLERAPGHPAAVRVYQELSLLQYAEGRSCPSFSHPPPARRF